AVIRNDMQIEQGGDKTFRIHLTDVTLAFFELSEFFEITDLAVLYGDDHVLADDEINGNAFQFVFFGERDGIDEQTVKIFILVELRPLFGIEYGFDRSAFEFYGLQNGLERLAVALQNAYPEHFVLAERLADVLAE